MRYQPYPELRAGDFDDSAITGPHAEWIRAEEFLEFAIARAVSRAQKTEQAARERARAAPPAA